MFRQLSANDAEAFKTLRFETLTQDPDAWLSNLEMESAWPISNYESMIAYGVRPPVFGYWGFFEDNKLVAYAQLSPNFWPKKKHIVMISDVAVAFDKREKGVGGKLIKLLIDKARQSGTEKVQLWVNSKNTKAIKFYENLGFKRLATLPQNIKEQDGSYQDEYLESIEI